MQIRGRTAFVTGAAGGLGRAIATELAAHGAKVVLSGRNEAALRELAEKLGGEVLVADLTDRADAQRAIAAAAVADIVVANAGEGDSAEPLTAELVDLRLDLNLRVPIQMTVACVDHHRDAGTPAHVVLVGSLQGVVALPQSPMYSATKFGLRGFALSMRQDCREAGIGISHVAPGFIRDAGMFARSGVDLPPGVRTKSPLDVARMVHKAITDDIGEVFVSPVELRLASTVGGLLPGATAALMKRVMPERSDQSGT